MCAAEPGALDQFLPRIPVYFGPEPWSPAILSLKKMTDYYDFPGFNCNIY